MTLSIFFVISAARTGKTWRDLADGRQGRQVVGREIHVFYATVVLCCIVLRQIAPDAGWTKHNFPGELQKEIEVGCHAADGFLPLWEGRSIQRCAMQECKGRTVLTALTLAMPHLRRPLHRSPLRTRDLCYVIP